MWHSSDFENPNPSHPLADEYAYYQLYAAGGRRRLSSRQIGAKKVRPNWKRAHAEGTRIDTVLLRTRVEIAARRFGVRLS